MASRNTIPSNTVLFQGDPNGTVTRQYALSYTNVYKLGQFLKRTSLASTYLYNNQGEYVISVRAYPINVLLWFYDSISSAGNPEDITIGPFSANDVRTKGYPFGYIGSNGLRNLPHQLNWRKLSTITISEDFNNFMDYSVTALNLYLPFYGWIKLDNSKYMGKTINVYASIDFNCGDILYSLCYDSSGNAGNFIESYGCRIAIDVALNQTNGESIVRNTYYNAWNMFGDTLSSMINAGAGSYTKGITGAITTGTKGTTNLMKGLEKHVYKGGVGNGRNLFLSPTSILLVKDKANPVAVNSDWEHINGYPLMETRTLSSLTGYTEVGEIEFKPNGADIYGDEINEIITLLKNGVIL